MITTIVKQINNGLNIIHNLTKVNKMIIDIRDKEITEIRVAETLTINISLDHEIILTFCDMDEISVHHDSIDHLILALEKVKELKNI